MATLRPQRVRSWLFAPADNPRHCAKALSSPADQVIWDLEDAVASGRKEVAREALAPLLSSAADSARPPWVRIQSPLTDGGGADLAFLRERGALGRLVIPKADATALARVASVTTSGEWLILIEGARGLWDLSHGRLALPDGVRARLAFGALDYALDLSLEPTAGEPELLHARSQIVWISRALGLGRPIDSVDPDFTNPGSVEDASRRSRALGFGGKLAIHPAQLAPIHAAFRPSPDAVDWARRVAAAVADGAGVAQVDGAMVDRPLIEQARAILDASDAAQEVDPC